MRFSVLSQFQLQGDVPSKVPDGEERGWIIPIGGAEKKENDPRILRRFVELCGGDAGRHRGHPHRQPAVRHRSALRAHLRRPRRRAGHVAIDFDTRRDCEERNRLERIGRPAASSSPAATSCAVTT
jgi:cyanophycinase